MEERIERYLVGERKVESAVVRKILQDKVMKYDDIAKEFVRWLETREYEDGIEIEGYTAKKIHEIALHLDGIGVYNFLVALRDDLVGARKIIDEGFVIK